MAWRPPPWGGGGGPPPPWGPPAHWQGAPPPWAPAGAPGGPQHPPPNPNAPAPRYVGGVAGTPWAAATAPDGRVYYVHRGTRETRWELPPDAAAAAAASGGLRPPPQGAVVGDAGAPAGAAPPAGHGRGRPSAPSLTPAQLTLAARVAAVGGTSKLRSDLKRVMDGAAKLAPVLPKPSPAPAGAATDDGYTEDDYVFDPAEVGASGGVGGDDDDLSFDPAEVAAAAAPPPPPLDPKSAFKSMLADAAVSPFAVWGKLASAHAGDARWARLPGGDKARKAAFDEYCREAAEREAADAAEPGEASPAAAPKPKRATDAADRAAAAQARLLASRGATAAAAATAAAEREACAASRAAGDAFAVLLAERVKNADTPWATAAPILASDPLKRGLKMHESDQRRAFDAHVARLAAARARAYRSVLAAALAPLARGLEPGDSLPDALLSFDAADSLVGDAEKVAVPEADRAAAWRAAADDALAGRLAPAPVADAAYDREYLAADRKRVRRE